MSDNLSQTNYQILALDVGSKRIGVARAQKAVGLVEALAVVEVKAGREFSLLDDLLQEWQPAVLVVGLPLNHQGQATNQTLWTRKWVDFFLTKVDFKGDLVYQDEFLTSKAARQVAIQLKHSPAAVDDLAACLILEDYLQTL